MLQLIVGCTSISFGMFCVSHYRVYGGLHFDKSSTDALDLGEKTAAYAVANFAAKWDKASAF